MSGCLVSTAHQHRQEAAAKYHPRQHQLQQSFPGNRGGTRTLSLPQCATKSSVLEPHQRYLQVSPMMVIFKAPCIMAIRGPADHSSRPLCSQSARLLLVPETFTVEWEAELSALLLNHPSSMRRFRVCS